MTNPAADKAAVSGEQSAVPIIGCMTDAQLGRAVRALRHRRNWTQADLGRRAKCSASTISRFERGRVRSCSVRVVRRILEALDAWIFMKVVWRGGELDRLLDADHARFARALVAPEARLQ